MHNFVIFLKFNDDNNNNNNINNHHHHHHHHHHNTLLKVKRLWMLKAAWEEKVITRTTESFEECKKRLYETKVRDWTDKLLLLLGAFLRDVEGTAVEESWRWLQNGYLKKETEGMICVAQEQALSSNQFNQVLHR